MTGELQYIADSFLIEKIARLDRAIITKDAGLASDIFSGVGSAVNSFVKSNIDSSSTGALIKSVLKLLEPAMFFKMHPILGILSTVASGFGFSVTDILSDIVGKIAPKLAAGEMITPSEVNQIGASLGSTASVDLFSDLRSLEKNGELFKIAQRAPQQPLGGSMFKAPKGTSTLYKLFGFLAQKKSKTGSKGLAVGFIVWFIKTILLSAGLLGVGSVTKKLITGDTDKESAEPTEHIIPAHQPNSKGQDYHPNDDKTAWYVPVVNKNISDTLLAWTLEFYPELSEYEDIIVKAPQFQRMVDLFSKEYERGKDFTPVPQGFNRRVDVINKFIKEVQELIKSSSTVKA